MTRIIVADFEDGSRSDVELETGETLRITKAGNLRVLGPDGSVTQPCDSPAVVLRELVEYAV